MTARVSWRQVESCRTYSRDDSGSFTLGSRLCTCAIALRPLDVLICETDLTARVRVRWGLSLPSGTRLARPARCYRSRAFARRSQSLHAVLADGMIEDLRTLERTNEMVMQADQSNVKLLKKKGSS